MPSRSEDRSGWAVRIYEGENGGGKTIQEKTGAPGSLQLEKSNKLLLGFGIWKAEKSGIHTFKLSCDDYGSLFLDEKPLITLSGISSANEGSGQVDLSAGYHLVTIKLHNGPGAGWAALAVKEPGGKDFVALPGKAMHLPLQSNIEEYWQLIRLAQFMNPAWGLYVLAGLLIWRFSARRGVSPLQMLSGLAKQVSRAPLTRKTAGKTALFLVNAWFLIVLACVVLEVLFQISKDSFLSALGGAVLGAMTINTIAMLMIPGILFAGLIYLTAYISKGRHTALLTCLQYTMVALLSLCSLSLIITHADTTFYSATGFNINSLNISDQSIFLRFLLFVLAAYPALFFARKIVSFLANFKARFKWPFLAGYAALLLFLIISGLNNYRDNNSFFSGEKPGGEKAQNLPNIILFSSDGVELERLSLYGYHLKTTPVLEKLAETSYVYYNNYAHANATRMSTAALLSGAHPFTTKVIHRQDILWGSHSFNHLPGILTRLGYYCVSFADDYFGAPTVINIKGAFRQENRHFLKPPEDDIWWTGAIVFCDSLPLVRSIVNRISNRWQALAGFPLALKLEKPLVLRKGLTWTRECDAQQIARLIKVIRTQKQPVFAHVHLVETHPGLYGCGGHMVIRRFSKGEQQVLDQDEFYDDSLLNMDARLGKVLEVLKRSGKWDNTIFVFMTDHGRLSPSFMPLPLVVHLPGQTKNHKIKTAVQYLDIAPSIINYLGFTVPDWMEGEPIFPGSEIAKLSNREIVGYSISQRVTLPTSVMVVKEGAKYCKFLGTSEETYVRINDANSPGSKNPQEHKKALRSSLARFVEKRGLDELAELIKTDGK